MNEKNKQKKYELINSVADVINCMAKKYSNRIKQIEFEDFASEAYTALWRRADEYIEKNMSEKITFLTFAFPIIKFSMQELVAEYQNIQIGYTNTKLLLKAQKMIEEGIEDYDLIAKKLGITEQRVKNLLFVQYEKEKININISTPSPEKQYLLDNKEKLLYEILERDFKISHKEITKLLSYARNLTFNERKVRKCEFDKIIEKLKKVIETNKELEETLYEVLSSC